MKNILVLSQKGGTGKTLICDELAYSFERTGTAFNFFELDSQGGNRHETQEISDAVVSVIDTPGYLLDDLPDMIEDADIIILPLRASASDQPALLRMRRLIQNHAPDTPVILVLNGWNVYGNTSSFMNWLHESAVPSETIASIPQSEMIPQSIGVDESVTAYAPRTRAAAQMRTLTNMVRTILGLDAEDAIEFKLRKGKKNG